MCAPQTSQRAQGIGNCGVSMDGEPAPSPFEIGKIAALATIRRDVLTWLGGSVAVIGAAFAILAYFGVNELVKSSVSEQVKKEVDKQLEKEQAEISNYIRKYFIDLGKSQKYQEQITQILT